MTREKDKDSKPLTVVDEPGMAERFQRGIRNLLNTPPQPRSNPGQKTEERATSKGRVHKGKTKR